MGVEVMKYLKSYKIFEADGPLYPSKWSWAKDLTIPRDIQEDIYDMAFELKDEGYNVSYQWWPPYEMSNRLYKDNKYPTINITKTIQNEEGGLEKISYAWVKDFCERVSSYLDDKDYNTVVKFRKVNTNDYYDINKSYPNQEPFSDHHMATSIHFRIEMIDRNIYGNVYESVHDTKEEIEEIVSTCKDIMLEAQHTFGNSDVEKSYKDDKVIISCFYKMPLDVKGKLEEYKSTMDDIHQRLIEYMTSQGFTYNNRGDKYTAYFDMMVGNITYNISFSKELDKEFIGHLRYLKKYNINESKIDQSVIDECKDILLELEDKGIKTNIHSYLSSGVSIGEEHNKNWIQFFFNRKEEFDYSDIEDVVERLKSYLSEYNLHIQWQNQAERGEQRPTIKVTRVMNPMTFTPEGVRTQCEIYFTSN